MVGEVRSWLGRLLGTVRHNLPQIAMDVVLITAWLVFATEALRLLGAPRWLQYLVLFAGVLVYAQVTPAWERPPADEW